MKKDLENLEFYINQKKIKENKKILFHKEVEINFKGRAVLINEDKKETDDNYQIELSNYYILNRSGNYKIIYTDIKGKSHIFYFSIRKKVPIFVFLILFLPILLSTIFYHVELEKKIIEKELEIEISEEEGKDSIPIYIFHMYLNNGDKTCNKIINLMETIQNKKWMSNKIAPGVKGKFVIVMDTYHSTQDLEYEIKIKDKTTKPKNLYFKSRNGIEYMNLEELAKNELSGKIDKNSQKNLMIQWEWKYEISDKNNQMDVEDSNQIEKYQFEVLAIGKEI